MAANTVEAIVNEVLAAIGYPGRVADIFEGTPAADLALDLFGQARDELLRAEDWPFATGVVSLTLLKGPPPDGGYNPLQPWSSIYPPPGYLYEYAYPSDCLELRAITKQPSAMPDLDPKPKVWRIFNDLTPIVSGNPPVASGSPQQAIATNQASAVAIYRRRVTNPLLWEPGFIASLVKSLEKKFAVSPVFATARIPPQEVEMVTAAADNHRG